MIVGIDLGTTNSAVALWRDGAAQMIPNSLGQVLTPSAVSIDEADQVIVGLAARERQSSHPDRTVTAFKRFMGSRQRFSVGPYSFTPEELSSLVLASLKRDVEAALGEPVAEAVIACPAYFNNKQREATRKAAQLAGLQVERLINEPTAAALAYGIADRDREARFLVFDLGGGTFDVSILEIFEGVLEVRATAGDNRLGGEDFNALLVERLRARFAEALGPDLSADSALTQRLRAAAERARRTLSVEPQAELRATWQGREEQLTITAGDFETSAEPLLARLRQPVVRALNDGRLRVEDIDECVLVGGATRMPVVRKAVIKMFGRFPSSAVDPDEAVARGAAVQAGLKARDAALREVVLTDVCPYSLGIEVAERLPTGHVRSGFFAPILERNTTIPASRLKTFHTTADNQSEIRLKIYQGEARRVVENISLGSLHVAVPPRPGGEVSVDVRFSYDINGLLEVDVHVPASGERREMVLVDGAAADDAGLAERRAALAALKVHPRDKDLNRAALARAERLYEEALGEARAFVGQVIARFEAALESQDERIVAAARTQLTAILDQMEGATFL